MNETEIEVLLREIRAKDHDVWIGGPASSEAIAKLERLVGSPLPNSYKHFLSVFGAMGIDDNYVSGILDNDPSNLEGGGLYADTMFLREESSDMPESLWVIKRHEDGAYCFDTTRSTDITEFAIVNFESNNNQHEVPIASNFSDFLQKWVLAG